MSDPGSENSLPQPTGQTSPPGLRYFSEYRLMTWQPQGVLDDRALDGILSWLLAAEKAGINCNRFIDFTRVTKIAMQIGHLFNAGEQRAQRYRDAAPLKTAFLCDSLAGHGTAHLYQKLMQNTAIETRVFEDRGSAAAWLEVPEEVLGAFAYSLPTGRPTSR